MMDARELILGIRSDQSGARDLLYSELDRLHLKRLIERIGVEGEDVLQELYLIVIAAVVENRIEEPRFLWAFAWTTADRIVRRHLQRGQKLVSIDDYELVVGPNQERRRVHAEQLRIARSLIERLPEASQRLIEMFYFEDSTAEEIQSALNL